MSYEEQKDFALTIFISASIVNLVLLMYDIVKAFMQGSVFSAFTHENLAMFVIGEIIIFFTAFFLFVEAANEQEEKERKSKIEDLEERVSNLEDQIQSGSK